MLRTPSNCIRLLPKADGGSLAAAGVELPIEGDGVEQPDALVVHGGGLAVGTLAVLGPLAADPPAQLGVVLDGDVARSLLGLPEGELGEALLPRGVAVALLAERGTASRAGSGTGRNGLSGEATLGGLLLYKSKVKKSTEWNGRRTLVLVWVRQGRMQDTDATKTPGEK